jgi:hypothetical protein
MMKVYGKIEKKSIPFLDGFMEGLRKSAPFVIPVQTITLVYCIWKIWFKG